MTQLYQNKTMKIALNALFLALATLFVVIFEQRRSPDCFYSTQSRLLLYSVMSTATVFSIHSWVILPKYFENKIKEYIIWCMGVAVAFILFLMYIFKINLDANDDILKVWAFVIPTFLVALVFTCALYASFFIKEFRFKFLEFILNTIIFGFFLLVASSSHEVQVVIVWLLSVITFYTHTFAVVPIFVKKQKAKYISSLIVLSTFFVVGVLFCLNLDNLRHFQDLLQLIIIMAGSLAILLLTSFIYGYYRIKLKSTTIKIEAKTSELNLLKSQVNPHFLFNTLNTLYALALNENAPKTAEATSKLANLLRYMENDMKKEHISITDEIKYLEDYIAIQKTRCAVEPELRFTTKNVSKTVQISPGLLIPLVENAFKHGIHLVEKSALTIMISCDEKQLHFMCANTYDENLKVHQMEKGFGIGLENVQKRLELLYAHDYTFEIDKQNSTFTVNLTIPRR